MLNTPVSKLISVIPDVVSILGDYSSISINSVMPIGEADENSLSWIRADIVNKIEIANSTKAGLVICEESGDIDFSIYATNKKCFVITKNAKLAVIRIVELIYPKQKSGIHESVVIASNARIGLNVTIGPNSNIGDSFIGDNVKIGMNCIIHDRVCISNGAFIHDNSIIGGEGFNYVKDNLGISIKFPYIGGVEIGSNVEIGSFSYISSGVLGKTKIDSGAKIGQYCYIGGNVFIGLNTHIRTRSTICGSAKVGTEVMIAPAVTIRDDISIGNNSIIGMGSIVTKNVPSGETWYGNPATKRK
ncbi:MAG: hypothetical protein WC699_06900 [Bacteroidales bacterium]|jgi:UDP-3-O-[3-hydroxymyristoyl] glucosamine N-acyltransferase